MRTNLFSEMLVRPWSACASALEMLSKDLSTGMRIDAALSRSIHNLCRAILSEDIYHRVVQPEANHFRKNQPNSDR